MAASVLEGRVLEGRMQSLVDQTDVEVAKEECGQMMSTGFQVLRLLCDCFCHVCFFVTKY